ncbi:MAG: helix-turn-helix transcriptional regulator [Candidatus Marinimicrobia bacterium]|nr:helix-turn-helix transcriptional regulator [bacterium]MCG2715647.1 helix-turn-helix transcriptional regulator [Candidatus Neomarinimicrobiota bacterium]
MSENSKSSLKEINDFFSAEPDAEDKAWIIIDEFYHYVATYMKNNNISRADLARRLEKSRAAVSQMFNKTPNLTIKKMVEIADAIGVNLSIVPRGDALQSRQAQCQVRNDIVSVQIGLDKDIEEKIDTRDRVNISSSKKMIYTIDNVQYSHDQFEV